MVHNNIKSTFSECDRNLEVLKAAGEAAVFVLFFAALLLYISKKGYGRFQVMVVLRYIRMLSFSGMVVAFMFMLLPGIFLALPGILMSFKKPSALLGIFSFIAVLGFTFLIIDIIIRLGPKTYTPFFEDFYPSDIRETDPELVDSLINNINECLMALMAFIKKDGSNIDFDSADFNSTARELSRLLYSLNKELRMGADKSSVKSLVDALNVELLIESLNNLKNEAKKLHILAKETPLYVGGIWREAFFIFKIMGYLK